MSTYKKLAVLYGTETGTALEVAERIALEISMLLNLQKSSSSSSTTVTLLPIDDTDWKRWSTTFDLIIFVIATAGNGDPPRTMCRTWKQLLQRNLTNANSLNGVNFCCFGLGDSTYPRFNYMAKMFHNRLDKGLGANPVIYRALGDDEDEQGYESELRPFLGELYYDVLKLVTGPSQNDERNDENNNKKSNVSELEKLLQEREDKMDEAEENDQEYEDEELDEKIHQGYGKCVDVCKYELGVHNDDDDDGKNKKKKVLPPLLWNVEINSKRRERHDEDEEDNDDHEDCDRPVKIILNDKNKNNNISPIKIEEYLQSKLNLSKFTVIKNERVTSSDHFQDVRSIHLLSTSSKNNSNHESNDVNQNETTFLPGDTFAMYPRNSPQAVSSMLQLLQLSPNDIITISSSTKLTSQNSNITTIPNQPFFNIPFRAEDLFTWVFDLHSATSRQILWYLSFWVDKSFKESANFDGDEIYERLLQLARYSMDDFMEYSTRERRPVWEMLQDFLPILTENMRPQNWKAIIISSLRHIAPRHFSICKYQNQKNNDDFIELLIAIHKVTTPMKRQRMGLCSSFISEFLSNDDEPSCFGFVESGVHTLPYPNQNETSRKMILVGPGTGIAPMRAVIQRIVSDQEKQQQNENNQVLVFTGHRHPEKDFPFSQEWSKISENKNNNNNEIEFFHAFSRFTNNNNNNSSNNKNAPKYVQHAILQNSETKQKVANILNDENSVVLISGNAKQMPKDVLNAFSQCLVDAGFEKSLDSAEKRLEKMRLNGRYVVDAWA